MKWSRRGVLLGAGAALVHGVRPALAAPVRIVGGPAFGAVWRVTLPATADPIAVRSVVGSIVDRVDAAMSPFRTSSEIARFNAEPSIDWRRLTADTAAVLAESLRIAALTSGAFDPTVGGAVGRFGFGPIDPSAPSGLSKIAFDGRSVRKSDPASTLDLCGVAKGYALDRIAVALRDLRIGDFLVELGGDVLARGAHPSARPWRVAIERPGAAPARFQRILRLGDEALATSGDAINGYEAFGRRYGHIIDPRTSRPAANAVASVSVIAATGAGADALATALAVMGPEDGLALAEQKRLPVLFVLRAAEGPREVRSSRIAPYILA